MEQYSTTFFIFVLKNTSVKMSSLINEQRYVIDKKFAKPINALFATGSNKLTNTRHIRINNGTATNQSCQLKHIDMACECYCALTARHLCGTDTHNLNSDVYLNVVRLRTILKHIPHR